jgi:hypothetical protein
MEATSGLPSLGETGGAMKTAGVVVGCCIVFLILCQVFVLQQERIPFERKAKTTVNKRHQPHRASFHIHAVLTKMGMPVQLFLFCAHHMSGDRC